MIYTLDYLRSDDIKQTAACIDGKWVAARPVSGTFRWEKLKAAWEVYRGRADAFKWPGGQ